MESKREYFPRHAPLWKAGPQTIITAEDSFPGVCLLGNSSAGKTTGGIATITESMLCAGYGALISTVKKDSATFFIKLIERAGRIRDLIHVTPDNGQVFNFLAWEAAGFGGRLPVVNIVALLRACAEMVAGKRGKQDEFFADAAAQLLSNAIVLLEIANGSVDIKQMFDLIQSLPQSRAEADSGCEYLRAIVDRAKANCPEDRELDLRIALDYFYKTFPSLGDRTSGSIKITAVVGLDSFVRDVLRDLFSTASRFYSGKSTWNPDMAWREGKVILLDVPVLDMGHVGKIAQVIAKGCMYRALERRTDNLGDSEEHFEAMRPVVIVCDEAAKTFSKIDQEALSVIRSHRGCLIAASQSVSSYLKEVDGDKAVLDDFLGNFPLVLYGNNSSAETNKWASESLGNILVTRTSSITKSSSGTSSRGGGNSSSSATSGVSGTEVTQFEPEIQSSAFLGLKTGDERSDGYIENVMVLKGITFAESQKRYMKVIFDRKHRPKAKWHEFWKENVQVAEIVARRYWR